MIFLTGVTLPIHYFFFMGTRLENLSLIIFFQDQDLNFSMAHNQIFF